MPKEVVQTYISVYVYTIWMLLKAENELSRCATGKEPTCQCRRHKRHRFDPCVRKMPWRRAWQPSPGFLPGESHEQKSLAGYGP